MGDRTVCILGLGYIGLPTAAVIASRGVTVLGVDISRRVVETINSGRVHIVEPDLDIAVHSAVTTGHLQAFTEPQPADTFLIAVPTPTDVDHRADLSCVEAAARSVAAVLEPGNTVIVESTLPVGATELMCGWMAAERPDLRFPSAGEKQPQIHVAHCPERVLPGRVLIELVNNDRVIGGMTEACCEAARSLYNVFVRGELVCTDVRTAEMCKLTENAYRDVNIAFANELSLICDRFGIDVWELIRLANRHPRVDILQPGAGVGGHCIAVDPWFIISEAPDLARLTRAARCVNDHKPEYVVERIRQRLSGKQHAVVACLGLAFKPDVDDLRESPALRVVQMLGDHQELHVLVVEPHIDTLPESLGHRDNVRLVSFDQAVRGADLLVGLVRHGEFGASLRRQCLDLDRILDFVGLVPPKA